MHPRPPDLLGLVFDWDGTVVDTGEAMLRSHRHAFRKHLGVEFPRTDEEFQRIIVMRVAEAAALYGGDHAAAIAATYDDYYNAEAYAAARVYPALPSLLRELKSRGYPLAVATNKGLRRVLTDMDHLGLHGLFDAVVTTEDTVQRKPHPAPLLKAAERLGLDPTRCAYLGDHFGDIIAARAAGMLAIAVLWGFFPIQELYDQHPDYVLERPEQLLALCPRRVRSGA